VNTRQLPDQSDMDPIRVLDARDDILRSQFSTLLSGLDFWSVRCR
jgi:hypothetical protein